MVLSASRHAVSKTVSQALKLCLGIAGFVFGLVFFTLAIAGALVALFVMVRTFCLVCYGA